MVTLFNMQQRHNRQALSLCPVGIQLSIKKAITKPSFVKQSGKKNSRPFFGNMQLKFILRLTFPKKLWHNSNPLH